MSQTSKPDNPADKKPEDKKPSGTTQAATNSASASNTTTGKSGTAKKHPSSHKTTKKRSGGFSLFLSLLIGSGAGAGGYYLWQMQQKQFASLEQANRQLQSTRSELERRLGELQRSSDDRITSVTQSQSDFQTNLNNIFNRIGNTTRDWMIAEAEHLLHIADDRLTLARDTETALSALRLADQRLRKAADPALNPVRKSLGQDIAALELLAVPDQTGLAAEIAGLQLQIDQLPLRVRVHDIEAAKKSMEEQKTAKADEAQNTWLALLNGMGQALQNLVTIRRHENAIEPLIGQKQASNLRSNIKLKLEQSRLALVQLDSELFKNNIALSRQWVAEYFDVDNPTVQNLIRRLKEIEKINIRPKLPNVANSLEQIRTVKQRLRLQSPKSTARSD